MKSLWDKRLVAMAAFGFVSGLPLPLSGFTFRLWLSDDGASLLVIGLTAWIGLAYSLKFLWAPLLDQTPPIAWLRRFGRRRGWLLLVQPLLCLAMLSLAGSRASAAPFAAFAAAACLAFLSATQDIVIDAWRIEMFPERRQGIALAVYVWGYRIALLTSTTGAIAAAAAVGWQQAFMAMAVLVSGGVIITLWADNPGSPSGMASAGLPNALADPITFFFARSDAWLVLAFVALFKLGEAMAGIMTAPFYRHLGFDKIAIAGTGVFSLCATLAGITLGGVLVARLGVGRALLCTGWVQSVAMGVYVLLSLTSGNVALLCGTVATEAFAQGLADAAFLSFLSGLCERKFAATQYALLSSIPALSVHTIGSVSGLMAQSLGWTWFYAICMLGTLPGMLLMVSLLRRANSERPI